jgi:hypothetical protein
MAKTRKAGAGMVVERIGSPPVTVYRRLLNEKVVLTMFPPLAAIPAAVRRLLVPQDVYVAALDDQTLFVSLAGRLPMLRAVGARKATEPRTSEELTKLLRKQDPKDVATLLVMNNSLHPILVLAADLTTRETFDQFEHIRLRVRADKEEATITVEVLGKSSDEGPDLEKKAKRVVEVLRELLPKVAADPARRAILDNLLKSFRIERKDALLTVTGKMSLAEARKLFAERKP